MAKTYVTMFLTGRLIVDKFGLLDTSPLPPSTRSSFATVRSGLDHRLIAARIVLPIAGAAALTMFACGPWSNRTAQSTQNTRHTRVAAGAVIGNALDVSVDHGVTFALSVTNNSRRSVELHFPDGRTHDFVVLDTLGRAVYRWSSGRMFTSAVRTKLMKAGNTVTFDDRWEPSTMHGKYLAVATLHSENYPVRTQVAFTLP